MKYYSRVMHTFDLEKCEFNRVLKLKSPRKQKLKIITDRRIDAGRILGFRGEMETPLKV